MRRAAGAVLLLAAVAGAIYLWRADRAPPGAPHHVDPGTCYECHADQTLLWRGSHHDLAMQEATPETVLGDFDDATFERFGVTSRFFREDGRFVVNTDDADGAMRDFVIRYTFGVEPLQQYLIEMDGGRLQALSICWDTKEKRWFHVYDEKISHDDPLHWTGRFQNWNFMCAECHSTVLERNYDAASDTYRTTWKEINVGCQACHGPGSEHVRWAKDGGDDETMGLAVRLKPKEPRVQVEACARCHARRNLVSGAYVHGQPLLDHYHPVPLRAPLYHAGGQILDEVYVYGSFIQTKKYHAGVRCSDCHDSHSARLEKEGNELCAGCHNLEPPPEYPTLQARWYDTPEHHFHEKGTEGSHCVECHMIVRNYMVVDPRHDHSFRVPRPDLTAKLGVPNACNDCHADKSAEWADREIRKRFPKTKREPHFAEVFAAARAGKTSAFPGLAALALDPKNAAIVRATALHELRAFPRAEATFVVLLRDEEALVRGAAVAGLSGRLPPERKADVLAPLLRDPRRWVRTEAARVLTEVPRSLLPDAAAFDAALAEFVARETTLADRPEGHLNLAVVYGNLGDTEKAEAEYRHALRLDSAFDPARFNLANLLNAQGRNEEAETVLRAILLRDPGHGEANYSIGLLLAEMDRLHDAEHHLRIAADTLTNRPRARYNHALVLQRLGRNDAALERLLQGLRRAPEDPGFLHAVVNLYVEQRRFKESLPYARRLAALFPRDPSVRSLLHRIETAAR